MTRTPSRRALQRQPQAVAALADEALDFAPDLLAIQERAPSRLPRAILMSVVALIGLLLAWSVFAKLDIVATAQGRLVPLSFTKVVQPAEAGVVTDILVEEGEAVREGQLLLRLDSRISQADTQALGKDVALKKLSLRRIEAERFDRAFAPSKADPAELYAHVEGQFRARRQAYLDSLAQESETSSKARADLLAAQQVHDKLTQTLPSYRRSADAYRKLLQDGFVGELAAAEKAREALEKEQDAKAQAATVASLQASIAHSERRLTALKSQYRSQLENERIDTLAQLNRSVQELEKSNVKAGLLEIRSPNAGVVKDLATTTKGAVVAAGALLMNIVPSNEPLQAEVLLRNEDVGFVAVGHAATLKVAAYPFQKYGLLDGTVALISADAADLKQAQNQQPLLSYRALVRLAAAQFSTPSGEKLALAPGMLVTAEIHQGQRSVLEYLLSPVRQVGHEAARER